MTGPPSEAQLTVELGAFPLTFGDALVLAVALEGLDDEGWRASALLRGRVAKLVLESPAYETLEADSDAAAYLLMLADKLNGITRGASAPRRQVRPLRRRRPKRH